jgi:ribosomal protein L7/L12
MASEKVTALVEEVKGLTVLELSELVHTLEEVFGVSAAAAAVAAPAAGAAAEAAEEKTEFDVILKSAGASKLNVIKAGFMDGKVLPLDEIMALAELPAKDVLQAQVLGTMLAPITSLAIVLKAIADEKGGFVEREAPAAE